MRWNFEFWISVIPLDRFLVDPFIALDVLGYGYRCICVYIKNYGCPMPHIKERGQYIYIGYMFVGC